jgi:ferredoxin
VNRAAREAATEALRGLERAPASLVELSSQGSLLIVGGPAAWTAATRARSPLKPRVLSDAPRPAGVPEGIGGHPLRPGEQLTLAGHLGAFEARIEATTGPPARIPADLVLDLGSAPLLGGRVAPPGYLAPEDDPAALEQALARLGELVGVFEKPTYFDYDPALCAHSRNGVTACTRCIDACATRAIVSIGEQVSVDPHLCQGLGSCSTVCPSAAVRYVFPRLDDSLRGLRTLLATYREAGGTGARVLIHDLEEGQDWLAALGDTLPAAVLPFPVEEVSSLGLEFWLCALAFGAADLRVMATPRVPAAVLTPLEEQIDVARTLAEGLGHGAERIRLARPGRVADLLPSLGPETAGPTVEPALFAVSDDKRLMASWALDHLFAHAPTPRPVLTLPVGAPFGTADVSARACTLCLACVSACPGHALQDGYDAPQLRFIEANCLQCGMCTRTCPENAVWISPRFLFDPDARRRPRVLHEEPPFLCVACGKAFATRSTIDRMTARLEGHWMFRSERARRRLMMCEDCRVLDAVQDADAMDPKDGVASQRRQ